MTSFWVQKSHLAFNVKISLLKKILVCLGTSKRDILSTWEWLEQNVMTTLESFESENDATDFLLGKIESLVTTQGKAAVRLSKILNSF